MPFNPCGRAVDWLNRAYTRKARMGRGPDAPIVDLIWYPTDLPFLPFPTSFGSHLWESDYPNEDDIGERYEIDPPKPNWNPGIPGLTGDHFCGTPAMFLDGVADYTGPPIEYDADHIPRCCGRVPVGTVTAGVRPDALVTSTYATATRTTAGMRPDALVTQTHAVTAEVTAGMRPASVVNLYPAGVAQVTAGMRPDALVTQTHAVTAEVTAGMRPDGERLMFGFTCATAPLIVPGYPYAIEWSIYTGGEAWGKLPIVFGQRYYGRFDTWGPSFILSALVGADCGSLTEIWHIGSQTCFDDFSLVGGFIYFRVTLDVAMHNNGYISIGYGECPP